MGALRTRLFVSLVGGSLALFLVAGVALRWTMGRWLQAEFDRALEARARSLVALTEFEDDRIDFDFDSHLMPQFAGGPGAEYFELWLADGALVQRSASFDRDDATRAGALVRAAAGTPRPAFGDLRLPDGRWGRQIQIDFVPRTDVEDEPADATLAASPEPRAGDRPVAILVVAREREGLDADLWRLSVAVAAVGAGLALALAGLTQAVLRVGLRSLDGLRRQVAALGVNSLGRRVEVPGPPEEIAVVIEQVNALLERLEAGFQRERRLSSDIAHELKTPIAELRTLCEVGSRWPDDPAASRAFFEDARGIALQMERIVVHLVALARCDEGREPVWTARVHVADVVESAWKPLAREAAAREVTFRPLISPAVCLETDPDKFGLIVANLLANAVAYSPPGGAITCAAEATDGGVSVTFSNRAEHLEPADLTVMFDRFWRKDQARTGGRHAGLGLALVRALADLLAIEITTRLDPDRTFRLTLGSRRVAATTPGDAGLAESGPVGPVAAPSAALLR
jgi:two-component system sensor histidine kinase QseC